MERIFLSPPHQSGLEKLYLERALASNYIAPLGPDLDAFEEEMSQKLGGMVHCVGLSSGTAALHLAIRLSGIGPGDTVLCSDLTFIASVSPVLWSGARPVFVDAASDNWNIDLDLVEEYLSSKASSVKPKILLITHLYGQPVDLERAEELCRRYRLELIEDAAEALGSSFKGRSCGLCGRFGVLSFNGNKIITTSGGGTLLCRNKADAEKARFLAAQAKDAVSYYRHSEIGYNYRLSNICAALGRAQLEVLEQRIMKRRAIFEAYQERLGDLENISFMPETPGGFANRWLTCVLFQEQPKGVLSWPEQVRLALEEENIEARPIWNPMHCQPVFRQSECLGGEVGEDIFARGLCLPSGTAMGEAELERICATIRRSIA